jgi:hypothetical protein
MIEKLLNKFGYYKKPEPSSDHEILQKATELYTMVNTLKGVRKSIHHRYFEVVLDENTRKIRVQDTALKWVIE